MEAKKKILKLSKSKLNSCSLENLYYSHIDKKIELSLKAIEHWNIFSYSLLFAFISFIMLIG